MDEEEIDELDRFAHILSKELKPVKEALQRAIDSLNKPRHRGKGLLQQIPLQDNPNLQTLEFNLFLS